jgi:regulator of sirC expression with transglutaminase-like and TPR domain
MFEENGFHGSRTNYYSESNSHLNEVIDDREGQPITLSVLYMEIARRAGLSVEGVGMPGHFLVRFLPQQGEKQLIDVYDGGEFLTREQALVQSSPGTLALGEAAFERATPRQIINRILRNLMFAKNPQDDPDRALRYLDAAIAIDPDSVESRGLRAVLRYQTNRIDEGLEDVGWLLERQPDGLDLSQVARLRDALEEKRATRDKAKNVPSK